jgi:MATE family multidrug resistance protein
MALAGRPAEHAGRSVLPLAAAEARATFALAWPLIVAQFATVALTTTDVVMMGWLGPDEIAAGSLAGSLLFPAYIFGMGVVTATAPLVAQGLGGRRRGAIRGAVREGLRVAALLALLLAPLIAVSGGALGALGQAPPVVALATEYLRAAAWMIAPALAFIPLRALVAGHGETGVVLAVALGGVVVNALANYALMFGNFGFPRLEMTGAGVATTLAHLAMLAALAAWVARRRVYRRYALAVGGLRADWARFREVLRIGTPIGLTLAAESGLFATAALLMGVIGPDALAAHAVALQISSIAFMAPMGLSHATTIRVGFATGRGDRRGARVAGWTSIALSLLFMSGTAALFWFAPGALVGLFLDPARPESLAPFALATTYLAIAAVFQIFDGAQVTAAAALRGMSDTAAPMAIALGGYWLVGLPVAWLLAFRAGFEGIGVWVGLAAGLAVAAIVLIARFALRTR